MSDFLERISKLSPQRLALLADQLNERVQAAEESRRVPLAVVGIGCRLPGGVCDAEGFWKLLSAGVDAVSEVPSARWDIDELYDRNPGTPGKMTTRWGGFIDNPEQFDPRFFGIAPGEAAVMDPQQRLLLETSWEALEHAGIPPSSIAGTRTGVFIGICNGDYAQIALKSPREKISPYFAPGLSHAVAAGRISYVLGLQGPSMAVDTSCSASLVAVHLACQSLRLRESNAALAGGVNLILNPDVTIALSQSRMMAPDGRCKAFSQSADGFVRAEGCGVVVLKRLPDALRDGNRILAVIRGSACNQDGRSSGLTAPNGPSQEAVISAALADAGLRPADVGYIEAHGTGTSLGDPIEIGALNAVFAGRAAGSEPLAVGSVKTNLGHLESAAGIAGLIKLVLSIEHGQIPASLHFDMPSRRIEWNRVPVEVPTQLKHWKSRGGKRVGGVSSFGFSGTNAHVLVEEYVEERRNRAQVASKEANRPLLFSLSAKTEPALRAMASRLRAYLQEHPSLPLADVAHTLNKGRSRFEFRAAVVAESQAELMERLGGFSANPQDPDLLTGCSRTHSPRVALIFDGVPTTETDFVRGFYQRAPIFRQAIEQCGQILHNRLEQPLASLLYSATDSGGHKGIGGLSGIDRIAVSFALQYAHAELWRSCGVEPHAVLGYGPGEFVAACIAGVVTLKEALQLATAFDGKMSGEFAEFVRKTEEQRTRILFIRNQDQISVKDSSLPERQDRRDMAPSAASALARENCDANLWIGESTAMQSFAAGAGIHMPGKWLASPGSCREFLRLAGALYVAGCDIDTESLYGDKSGTVISLPTYPFQRERYWLDEANTDHTNRTADGHESGLATLNGDASFERQGKTAPVWEDWLYELVWEPKPLPPSMPQQLKTGFRENLIASLPVRSANAQLIEYSRLSRRLEPVCAAYIFEALRRLGADSLPDRPLKLDELAHRFRIAASRQRLFERLLAILVDDGAVEKCGDGFQMIRRHSQSKLSPEAEMQMLQTEFPLCRTEMNVIARCGDKLASVLLGETNPLHLLFPNNSTDETEQIYRNSPVARYYNESIAGLVSAAADSAPGRVLRILEIGAGTGATTQSVLANLAGRKFEYTFTDISPSFLARARAKFAEYPSLQCRILNIENDPVGQGFDRQAYDIVIAANVLHATSDLRLAIAHVRELIAPFGLVLLLEGMRPDRGVDLTFGLTDGWWRFTDHDVRMNYPLVPSETWRRLLQDAGIASTRVMTYASEGGAHPSHQMVVVAQAPLAERARPEFLNTPRRYILLADDSGIGTALQALLNEAGEFTEIIGRSDSTATALARLSESLSGSGTAPVEIVYLWATNVSGHAGSPAILSEGEELCVKTPAHIIQAMLRQADSPAHLWLVTRGAQATRSFAPGVDGATQSMMWGVGRAFGLENPESYRRLIDLAPDQSPREAAECILAELRQENVEDQIAYRDGYRLAARLERSSLEKAAPNPSKRLRNDSAYLVTGGLGGIGLRVSRWAALQGAGHLVLLGRTGTGANAGAFAAERLQVLHEIVELGAGVTVVEADVASQADMERLFRRFAGELPPLRGIFHAATVWGGVRLANATDQQVERMLRPKVLGTWVLHELTKDLELDFFLSFSSAASLLGARGMAHYAAANHFLDTFAHFRRAAGLPMLSVNWGAWDAMRLIPAAEQTRLREAGVSPMPSDKVLSLFGDLIASKRAQVMVASVDWDVPRAHAGTHKRWPLLEHLDGARLEQGNADRRSAVSPISLNNAIAMRPGDRRKFIESYVLEQAAGVLGMRRGELPRADVPLIDLGLDSLMAVDLKNHLQTALGRELPPTIVFDYPTVTEMVGLLETMLWASQSKVDDNLASPRKDEICI